MSYQSPSQPNPSTMQWQNLPFRCWVCAGAFWIALFAGCNKVPKPEIATLPANHAVRTEKLVILSDFKLAESHPLLTDLKELRKEITTLLELPQQTQDVMVYLFRDEETYRSYLESVFPGLPNRRAYFVGTNLKLAVYTYWGDRIQEDLRHEITHGILHASLGSVPLWLDEGLAEYFEEPGQGTLHPKPKYSEKLRAAVADGWTPDLVRLEQIQDFTEMHQIEYQESWAWVHYLIHHSPDSKALLLDYLHDLMEKKPVTPLSDRLQVAELNSTDRLLNYVASIPTLRME